MDDCFRFQDERMRFSIKGEGPALMLVHGFTESRNIWFDFADELSRDYTVIMPDLPGHGQFVRYAESFARATRNS